MSKIKINTSDEPIRLFKSDLLEFFTHVSPITVLVIWLPVVGFFVYWTINNQVGFPLLLLLFGVPSGLFFWTLAEYVLHRFLFHFSPKTEWQERVSFLFHGIHHAQPKIKTRLVMPPAVSIPLAMVFYGLFYVLFSFILLSPNWVAPIFAGFILGYVIYDMTHYSTHHIPMRKGYLRKVRQHHMHHHFQTPDQRFGVTSPLWDQVFGTLPGVDKKPK